MPRTDFPVEDALEMLLAQVAAPDVCERAALLDSVGRVLCQDIHAQIDYPPFDRSPLDGYAMVAEDTYNASREHPARLRVTQQIFAGDPHQGPLLPGQAARVMTGAPLPPGAGCVVRQEDTTREGDEVLVYTPMRDKQNYIFRGEDVHKGQHLIRRGTLLTDTCIGMIAGQGYTDIPVYRRPRIGILSTGSELIEGGGPLPEGKIYDSNRYTLAARAKTIGAQVTLGPNTEDDPDSLAAALEELLRDNDLVVTTGGVSVGEHDYMPLVGEKLGARQLFHGVACKPGSPVLALEKDGKIVLCLSGNPFACVVTFELFACPVIRKLSGNLVTGPERVSGTLRGEFPKESPGRRFIRARMVGGDVHISRRGHQSGALSTLPGCNCLIDIPAGNPGMSDGDRVDVIVMEQL